MSYLGNLTLRLASGASHLDRPFCLRQAEFFRGRQNADGGFRGRRGPSDLYYTGFALRGLALIDALDGSVARPAAQFLEERLGHAMSGVDFFSLVYSAILLELACGLNVFDRAGLDPVTMVTDTIAPLRRADGGYARTAAGGHGSTYHTFLAVSCLQLVGTEVAKPEEIVAMARARQRPDGGFVELGRLTLSGTNPTAAAVGLLRLLDAVDAPIQRDAATFLASMQNVEGGIRANTRIPAADLLSTFTGLVALADLDAIATIDTAAARHYIEALELDEGGFRGGAWDDDADVEYGFYGLAALALLAELDC